MNDILPLRRRETSQPYEYISPSLHHDEEAAPWSTTAQRASPAYFPEGLDSEDIEYGDIDSPASSNFSQHDRIFNEHSRFATPDLLPEVCRFQISVANYL